MLFLREFDQFAECAGFKDVSEEVLGSLLDDNALVSEGEEWVLKGVVRWMKGGGEGMIRGEGLLRKVRFPFMSAEFLFREARALFPECAVLDVLVLESDFSRALLNLWKENDLRFLDAAVLVPLVGRGG